MIFAKYLLKAEIKGKGEMGKKRAQLGTIRQMWNDGCSYEDIEHTLLDTIPELNASYSESDDSDQEE